MGHCTEAVDCFPVFLFSRTWIQCSYEPHHKKRNQLQISARGDLRMLLTNIEPNINNLISSHQVHPSH